MTSPYTHLIKLYQMLILDSCNKEIEKQRMRPPTRVTVGWLGGEGLCFICGSEGGLVGLQDLLQEVDNAEDTNSIVDLFYKTFHIEIVDDYNRSELCITCLNRLREADLFRRQLEAAGEPTQPPVQAEEQVPSEKTNTKPKRSIFSSKAKKESSLPPKLDKDAKSCPVCGEQAIDFYHLRVHYMRHYLTLICEVCGRGFYQQKSLDMHMMQHAEKNFTCQFCNKDYATKITLNQHIKSVHRKVKMYPCKECSARFSSSTTRMKHMWEDHGVPCRTYQCEECNLTFYTIQRRDLHMKRRHLQVKDHECEWCDFSAVSAVELTNHKSKHSDVRNYNCEHCGKLFKSQRSVKEHIKTHQIPPEEPAFQYHLVEVDNGDTVQIDNMNQLALVQVDMSDINTAYGTF